MDLQWSPFRLEGSAHSDTCFCTPLANARRLTVADDTKLLETETTFREPLVTSDDVDKVAGLKPALEARTRAFQAAPVRAGRYLIVIYAPKLYLDGMGPLYNYCGSAALDVPGQ